MKASEIISKAIDQFVSEILHGDEQHQKWLLDKAEEFKSKL